MAQAVTSQRQNIANLINDFGFQGNNGWYYGYGTSNSDFSLATYDGVGLKYFQSGIDGLEMKSNFVHPAVSKGAIYKWVVGVTGKIDLTGKYTKSIESDSNPSWPDGVKLKIYHDSQIIKEDSVNVSNSAEIIDNININKLDVKAGDSIYFIITANSNNAWDGGKLDISINPVYDNQNIFPKSQQSNLSFVGDTMPYYENGKFNVFYLDDIRDNIENGFHPWSLLQTDNLYNYTNQGIVINHSNNSLDQDLALGTGSVMKDKNGLYHAFFTGFNDRRTDVVSQLNKANLASDFGSQGNNRWNYGYGTSNTDFTLATVYDASGKKYYQSGLDGLELHPDFVQPSASKGAIYRWTAGENGKIDLTGTYTKYTQNDSNPSWPDGVTLTIYRNNEILQRDVVPVSNLVQNVDNIKIKMLNVNQGDNIYFVITANNNNAWDGGKLDVSINPTEIANEAIMHATSTDLKTWTKIYNDTFFASAQYSKNDFRDTYVFYNQDDNKYWMLITTRKGDTGVIAKYVSDDLKNWTDQGVFFTNDMNTSNLECPTLIKYGSYWYLTFSDQSAADPYGNRVVHYRKASSINGPFTKPARDSFDGNGFYAGKLEKDSSNNLYLFGWTPTKVDYNDSNAYDWAGNLVVHQIKQNTNGDLYATPVGTFVDKINHSINLTEYSKTSTVTKNNSDYSFTGNGYESVTFNEITGTNKITGKINTKSKNNNFGFMFNVGENGKAPLNIVFNHQYGRLEFYNVSTDGSLGQLQSTKPITVPDNGTLDFTILINDSVAVLYVNNEVAFSTRMYNMQNHKWGIFSMDSDITFSSVQLSK
jgi:beta-fructofuranosidase